MSDAPPRVAVVGAGITGLAAAYRLRELSPDADVVVFERSERPGGKILTLETEDGIDEAGPDSFLARDPIVEDLCRALGLGDDLAPPAVFGAKVWRDGSLASLPPSTYGIPASPAAALRAEPLGWMGRVRALGDVILPGPLRGSDLSVGALVRRRFGAQVLNRLVDPLLAGTRAGDPDSMSLAAALPAIDEVARRHRSVMKGLNDEGHTARPPPFLGLRRGMRTLVERLAAEGGAHVRTADEVLAIGRADGRYVVRTASGNDLDVAGVIVTTPPYDAARLLDRLSPRSARLLATIRYASVASVSLTYPSDAMHVPPRTSGVLVARDTGLTISALTWTSAKWPDRARPGRQTVRCFVGRSGEHPALELDDDTLAVACSADVARITGTRAQPGSSAVTRWSKGLPQYEVGHVDRVTRIEEELGSFPAIAVAGAGYRGSGLPDCVRQGFSAAEAVASTLHESAVGA